MKRYPKEFKIEAVKQITEPNYPIGEVAKRLGTDLIMNALIMAIWKRKPKSEVIVHSDQGNQYISYEWQDFLKRTI